MFRSIRQDDYDKGMIELLSELTTIDKNKIDRSTFEDWVKHSTLSVLYHTIVLEKDLNIIACGTLLVEPKLIHNMGFVGHIEDVVVKNDQRGKGIGKDLVQALIDIAEDHKCYKVILDCSENNVEFYEKCGLEKRGVQMAHYFK